TAPHVQHDRLHRVLTTDVELDRPVRAVEIPPRRIAQVQVGERGSQPVEELRGGAERRRDEVPSDLLHRESLWCVDEDDVPAHRAAPCDSAVTRTVAGVTDILARPRRPGHARPGLADGHRTRSSSKASASRRMSSPAPRAHRLRHQRAVCAAGRPNRAHRPDAPRETRPPNQLDRAPSCPDARAPTDSPRRRGLPCRHARLHRTVCPDYQGRGLRMTTTPLGRAPTSPPATSSPPAAREWWQRLAVWRAHWLGAHPRAARVRAVTRTVVLAGSLLWLLGLWLFLPELRLGMRAYLGCLWVVVAWFALARTKTLTWSGFLSFFAMCVPWSVGIGLVTTIMAGHVAQIDLLAVSETGAQVAIAGIVEEAGKLVPIVGLALLAPRRAARFATIDWLLLGLASGTAFLAVEESVRRTALATGNAGFGSLLGLTADAVLPPGYVRFGLTPIPAPMSADSALLAPTTVGEFGGHAIMTALVTGVAGLA